MDWTTVGVGLLVLGYSGALIVSLVKWQGFREALRRHTGILFIMIFLTILFLEVGGVNALLVMILMPVFWAFVFGMTAGPMGIVVGFFIGVGLGLYFLFYSLFI